MRVSLTTHGGIAATTRMAAPARVLDSAALPAPDAATLARLIAAARAAPPPGGTRPPDAMGYTITIEDNGQTTTLAQNDTSMTDAFATLRNWLRDHLPG